MARLLIRDAADADIDDIALFIARDNLEAGKQFYDAVLHDMLQLSAMPGMGGPRPSLNPRLKGLRSWPIKGVPELPHLLPAGRKRN